MILPTSTLPVIPVANAAITTEHQDGLKSFATRDEGSGGGGVSGAAIGGIIAGVVIILLIILFLVLRSRRPGATGPWIGTIGPAAPVSPKAYHVPYPEPHPPAYLPQYTGPGYAFAEQMGSPAMPPAVHLPRNSGYYAHAPTVEPQKGVRFGGVGVARYT